jgi:hypothetical protein
MHSNAPMRREVEKIKGPRRGSAPHAASLARSAGVVIDEIGVESDLHLVDALEQGLVVVAAEVLVEQRVAIRSTMPLDCGRLTRLLR